MLFKVLDQTLQYEYNQWKQTNYTSELDCDISQKEKEYYGAVMARDMEAFEQTVKSFVDDIFKNENILDKEAFVNAIDASKEKPFFSEMTDKAKKSIKRRIATHIKENLKKLERTNIERMEAKYCIQRFFLKELKPNDEFDVLLVDGRTSTVYQFEVKSYPQDGKCKTEKLKEVLNKADFQLSKGRKFFEQVIFPLTKIETTWTMRGCIFLPNIKKNDLKELKLNEEQLVHILVDKDELTDILLNVKTDGNLDEFRKIGELFVGSASVSFQSQVVDHSKIAQAKLDNELRRMGSPNSFPAAEESGILKKPNFSDLHQKALGHITSVIYWNKDQLEVLKDSQMKENILLAGDYGTGKTILLMAAARKAAENQSKTVIFIPATGWRNLCKYKDISHLLDIKLKLDLEPNVQVIKLSNFKGNTFKECLQNFLDKEGNKESLALFLDEVEMSRDDWKKIREKKGSPDDILECINKIESQTSQAWIVLAPATRGK